MSLTATAVKPKHAPYQTCSFIVTVAHIFNEYDIKIISLSIL